MSMQKLRAALVAIVPQVSREDSTSHAGKHARPSILKKDHKVNVVEEHGQDSDQHGEDEEQRDDADEDDPYRLEEQAQVLMTEAARRRHRMRKDSDFEDAQKINVTIDAEELELLKEMPAKKAAASTAPPQ
eukprot:symbB.v1.2.013087.t1/scaffold920.1/size152120/9